MKTKHCDECKWFAQKSSENVCRKQHHPRFYAPKTISQAQRGNFGWKRRCEDFEGVD